MTDFPALETERLMLRRMTLDDAPFYLRHFSDPDIVELTAFEAPKDLPSAREELLRYCIEPFTEGTGIRWAIVLKSTGETIGTCGYHAWDRRNRSALIGYDLARDHRGKGIMTEALDAMLRHGFGAMDLNRIEVRIDPTNTASLRVVQKLGFTREGVLRETTAFRGRFRDDVCFSLLRRERADLEGWTSTAGAAERTVP